MALGWEGTLFRERLRTAHLRVQIIDKKLRRNPHLFRRGSIATCLWGVAERIPEGEVLGKNGDCQFVEPKVGGACKTNRQHNSK